VIEEEWTRHLLSDEINICLKLRLFKIRTVFIVHMISVWSTTESRWTFPWPEWTGSCSRSKSGQYHRPFGFLIPKDCYIISLSHILDLIVHAYPSGAHEFASGCSRVRVTRSLVLFVMFCRSLFVTLSCFSWPLCCLFVFELRILNTPLVS